MVNFSKDIKKRAILTLILLGSIISSVSIAIDNPDAPELVTMFKTRASTYMQAINNPKNSNRDNLLAYNHYHQFLDAELNTAYQLLKTYLTKTQQQELKVSQQKWLKFRDAESVFIQNNWNHKNFGSSSTLSRGAYQGKIIEDRILQLLNYSLNY